MIRTAVTLLLLHSLALQCAAQWGDLSMRFVYDGPAPQPIRLADVAGAQFCGDASLTDQRLVVNATNRGIANVIVYVYQGTGGRKLSRLHQSALEQGRTLELANVNCNYVPRVLAMMAGDRLRIVNTDILGYNAMLGLLANDAQNFAIPPKSKAELLLPVAEPAPVPVDCTIYPWMKAKLLILDHRYAGVSNRNGEIILKNLPADESITLRIYHEAADLRGLSLAGSVVNSRGVFELQLKAGANALGDIPVPPSRFQLEQN